MEGIYYLELALWSFKDQAKKLLVRLLEVLVFQKFVEWRSPDLVSGLSRTVDDETITWVTA